MGRAIAPPPPLATLLVRDNFFQDVLRSSAVTGLLGCLQLLIAIFGLEVCDVIIMLQFVIESAYTFFKYGVVQRFFWI